MNVNNVNCSFEFCKIFSNSKIHEWDWLTDWWELGVGTNHDRSCEVVRSGHHRWYQSPVQGHTYLGLIRSEHISFRIKDFKRLNTYRAYCWVSRSHAQQNLKFFTGHDRALKELNRHKNDKLKTYHFMSWSNRWLSEIHNPN